MLVFKIIAILGMLMALIALLLSLQSNILTNHFFKTIDKWSSDFDRSVNRYIQECFAQYAVKNAKENDEDSLLEDSSDADDEFIDMNSDL